MALTLRDHNTLSEELGLPPVYRGAVISVHGMRSRGTWQKDLGPCLQDAGIRHVAVDYGMVLAGALMRRTPRRIGEKILAAYEEQLAHHPRPSAIGHSLGSLAIGWSLLRWTDLVLKRVILFGSILSREYPWPEVAGRGQVDCVLNEVGRNDLWPKVAAVCVPDSGQSGCKGFLNADKIVLEREYPRAGHSDLEYRLHYKRVWIPFLRGMGTATG